MTYLLGDGRKATSLTSFLFLTLSETAELGEAYRHERKYMKKIVALLMAVLSLTTASATILKDHYEKIKGMTGYETPLPSESLGAISAVCTVIPMDSIDSVIQTLPKEHFRGEVKLEHPVYLYVAKADEMESEGLLLMPNFEKTMYVVFFVFITNDNVDDFIKQTLGE